jgi:hypothetical protein
VDEQINACCMELAERDRISASFWIAQFPIENLLRPRSSGNSFYERENGAFEVESYEGETLIYSVVSAGSYYFEVDGECSVDIYETSTLGTATLQTLSITAVSIFTPYVGFITAVDGDDTIQLAFYTEGSTFDVRNVALYEYTFNGVTASIPYYQPYVEYAIPENFYELNRIRSRIYTEYRNFTDYRIDNNVDNDRMLLIPRNYRGEFVFEYWKYPTMVTTAVQTFEIMDANALKIPWGVAGSIMLGNGFNARVGQMYMDMYERKKNSIKMSHNYGQIKVDNIKGW